MDAGDTKKCENYQQEKGALDQTQERNVWCKCVGYWLLAAVKFKKLEGEGVWLDGMEECQHFWMEITVCMAIRNGKMIGSSYHTLNEFNEREV